MYKVYWFIFVTFIIFIISDVHVTDARRGGGGVRSGTRSTSRTTRSSSSSGSVRTTRFGTRYSYRGPSYSPGSWKTAAAVGTLYGVTSYQRRKRYFDNPDSEPRICFNEQNLRNGTYGYFICPEEGMDDDMAYCCGDEDAQRCCTYTDASAVGRIVGIVIGVLILCAVIGVVVYCFCVKRGMFRRKRSTGRTFTTNTTQQTANPTYNAGYTGFQDNNKQDPSPYPPPYPPSADGTNVYATIDDGSSQNPSAPIGFEEGKQLPQQNGVSAPPPYSDASYSGFQGIPTVPPPAYDAGHI